jgi:hypothetical protein
MKITTFCVCWLLILTAPGVMAQQAGAPNQSWDVLRQMAVVGNLRVERKDGKKFSGEIIRVTDTELEINRKGKLESFRRDEVKKVWLVVLPNNRTQFQTTGMIASILPTIIITLKLGSSKCGDDCGVEKAGVVAALVGIPIIGLLVGRALAGKSKRTLIYVAP